MVIPFYGFLEGDTLGLLILAEENETIESLAQKVLRSGALRVSQKRDMRVIHQGIELPFEITVKESGMKVLDIFYVQSPPPPTELSC